MDVTHPPTRCGGARRSIHPPKETTKKISFNSKVLNAATATTPIDHDDHTHTHTTKNMSFFLIFWKVRTVVELTTTLCHATLSAAATPSRHSIPFHFTHCCCRMDSMRCDDDNITNCEYPTLNKKSTVRIVLLQYCRFVCLTSSHNVALLDCSLTLLTLMKAKSIIAHTTLPYF